ncbi:MAG: hypothetical protein WKG01_01460 [Kofleriaceae bacterium]
MDDQMLAITHEPSPERALADELDDGWYQFDDTAAVDDGVYQAEPPRKSRLRVVFALGAAAAMACVGFAAM